MWRYQPRPPGAPAVAGAWTGEELVQPGAGGEADQSDEPGGAAGWWAHAAVPSHVTIRAGVSNKEQMSCVCFRKQSAAGDVGAELPFTEAVGVFRKPLYHQGRPPGLSGGLSVCSAPTRIHRPVKTVRQMVRSVQLEMVTIHWFLSNCWFKMCLIQLNKAQLIKN